MGRVSQETIQGYRLSPQQKHLWSLLQSGQSGHYQSYCWVQIDGELDTALLKQALDHAVAQHEILRTTFQMLPGMTIPVQVIADKAVVSLETRDLTDLSIHESIGRWNQFPSEVSHRDVNYARLPLLRADLIRVLSSGSHCLLLSTPVFCADGPSLQILVRQIAGAYAALQRGKEPATSEPMQYADFAEWQNERLESEAGAAGRQYWKRLDLTQAFARRMSLEKVSAAASFQPAAMAIQISSEAAKEIDVVATKNSVSISSFFLACWQIVLSRSAGWAEPMTGVALDGRKFDELKEAVGLLLSFLPIQSELTGPLSFTELVRHVNDSVLEAQRFQEYFSWEQLPVNDRAPGFFPFCFEFRTLASFAEAGLTFSFAGQETGSGAFKLKFVCEQRGEDIVARLEYDPNVFSVDDVGLFAGRLKTVIEEATSNPEASVFALELLGPTERQLLLADFNDTVRDFSTRHDREKQCIHRLFEAQVAKNPAGIALVFEDEKVTYAELNARANQLAHYLRRLGVGPDLPVALALDRSVDLIVALLGILKAGGAYVPLDPGLPTPRLTMMLADAGARVLVTRGELATALRDNIDHVLCLDTDRSLVASESTTNPVSGVYGQNLVYIIFTSGSTGRPKGVAVEHRQLVNYVNAVWEKLALPEASSFATVSTVAADLGNTVLFPPLLKGGTLHLISEERATNPDALADYCRRHPIDCLKIVPSHLAALLSAARPADVLPRRRLVLGGEASSWSLIEKIRTLAPDCQIVNHYGPTEATVGAVTYDFGANLDAASIDDLRHRTEASAETVPLGRPLGNVQVFILDEELRPAPIGAPGELHIGGEGVARGYINRADATAEKFIPDPFNGNGARLYKTGDRARYLSDGRIEFLGRVDDQVKIHGFRIEPREIELALCEHPAVTASAVVAREDESEIPGVGWKSGDKRLVAYCIVKDHQSRNPGEFRTFLKGKLPEYMVPSAFVFLEQIPLTANGKLDRRALPAPDRFRHDGEGVFAAPLNPVEERLARLWANVLGVERVGIHDNFFELGGDSILSIQIIARANQAGLRLSPRQLFQHQTIAELAAVAGTIATTVAEQGLVSGPVPLTPVQARFFAQEQPAPHHYNQAMVFDVEESLDAELFERALGQLIAHHDALRLRFERSGDGWRQAIMPPDATGHPAVRIERFDATEFQERAADLQASLNLESGPLVRVAMFARETGEPKKLLIVIHHLLVDGVSWRILLEDLQTLYTQLSRNKPIELPAKTTSFKSWSEQVTAYAKSGDLLAEAPYWLSLFPGSVARLPVDQENGSNPAASARTVTVSLTPRETLALLMEVPAAYRTQINEVLLTALAHTLSQWTRSPTVLLDLEGHGREEIFAGVDLSRTVGWFTTIFPVVLDLKDAQVLSDSLRLVKDQLRAIPRRGIGYGVLRYLSGNGAVVSALNNQPQAEVRFNYLGQTDRAFPAASLFKPAPESTGPAQNPAATRGYLLNIIGAVTGHELRLEWTYSENIHRRETIERLAASYLEDLRTLIANSRAHDAAGYSPSDFPQAKLDQTELDKVLSRLRQT